MTSLSDKNKSSFYLPGEEINISRQDMFSSWNDKSTSGYADKWRLISCIICCALAYLLVCFRLIDTCILANLNEDAADDAFYAAKHTNTHRADIVDRRGSIIATSLPTQDLDANAKNILSPRQTAQQLVEIFPELNFDQIYKKLKRRRGTFTIKRNLSPHQQSLIMALGNPGLEFRRGEKRIYPHKNLMAQVIGTTDIDNEGVSGMEKGLNERIVMSELQVTLSLDLGVQDTVRTILYKNMRKFKAKSATSILMNVNTGEIVSMVSLPDYDPNNITQSDIPAMLNTATARVYEPGSVLKIFNTAMSLESGKVKLSEHFDASQPLKLKYNTIYDFHPENRWLSVEEIMVHSSNIGSARMALQAGFSEQYHFLEKIKFFDRLNLELVETAQPLVPKKQRWSVSDSTVATVGYGYGISVSPLHLITAYSAVVNGGIYHNPSLLKQEHTPEGFRVLSDNTSKQMRKLLRAVITKGSGRKANVLGYEVGGKTGTANKLENGKYQKKRVMTTFLSAFPISKPKYALYVMMDEPQGLEETFRFSTAGWNVVPTGAEIISAVAPQLNIPANYDLEEKRNNKIIEAAYGR